jgi:uncharacterized protein involved in response to NO
MGLTILTGLGAVGMLMLGFNMIAPLGQTGDTICDLAGIVCAMMFIGLVEA